MDNETRFWLASQITEQRQTVDARNVLAEASNKPFSTIWQVYQREIFSPGKNGAKSARNWNIMPIVKNSKALFMYQRSDLKG